MRMRKKPNTVAGANAPAARPTYLGAALAAVIITFPVAALIVLIDLLLL